MAVLDVYGQLDLFCKSCPANWTGKQFLCLVKELTKRVQQTIPI